MAQNDADECGEKKEASQESSARTNVTSGSSTRSATSGPIADEEVTTGYGVVPNVNTIQQRRDTRWGSEDLLATEGDSPKTFGSWLE